MYAYMSQMVISFLDFLKVLHSYMSLKGSMNLNSLTCRCNILWKYHGIPHMQILPFVLRNWVSTDTWKKK
jgi:hypothetical protein